MAIRHVFNLLSDTLHSLPIVILYLTDGCNSRCATCDIWRNPRLNMRRELVKQLAADVSRLGVRWAVLSGGEAMQHQHWPEIAQQLRAAGARVLLLTNGLLIRKQIDDVIANVDEVIVSLDGGTRATYEAIRGVDGLDLVLDGIRLARAAGLPVTTRTVVQRDNFRELAAIIDAAKGAGASTISFLTVDVRSMIAFGTRFGEGQSIPLSAIAPNEHPPTGALSPDDVAELARVLDAIERDYTDDFASGCIAESPAKLRRMIGYFDALANDRRLPGVRCNAPHTSAVIEVDGRVRPCYFLPTVAKIEPGAIDLYTAINAREAIAMRRAQRRGERGECAGCVCSLYKGARDLAKI